MSAALIAAAQTVHLAALEEVLTTAVTTSRGKVHLTRISREPRSSVQFRRRISPDAE